MIIIVFAVNREIPALVHALITRLLEVSWSSEDESAVSEVCADDIKHVWWVVLVADANRLMYVCA